jgi:hypothetical protein
MFTNIFIEKSIDYFKLKKKIEINNIYFNILTLHRVLLPNENNNQKQ